MEATEGLIVLQVSPDSVLWYTVPPAKKPPSWMPHTRTVTLPGVTYTCRCGATVTVIKGRHPRARWDTKGRMVACACCAEDLRAVAP